MSHLLATLLALTVALAASGARAEGDIFEQLAVRLAADEAPEALAAELPVDRLDDIEGLNRLRLRAREAGKTIPARKLFQALRERSESDAVLLNLSLTYVDDMPGKTTLEQGWLSTRSQDAVEVITERQPESWIAWYIRGINNLYWPKFFGNAKYAREYLTRANAIHQAQDSIERQTHEHYALGYLALGDAHALLDEPDKARTTWRVGAAHYPYVKALQERLALSEAGLNGVVSAMRDPQKPISTDLGVLWNGLSSPKHVTLTGGILFGPGPIEDQPLDPGGLKELRLAAALTGTIAPFNNGGATPNLPGELRQGKIVDGLLSDGAEVNEHVDVGFVSLMNGRFNLFLAAVQDGPHQGRINFFIDQGFHWTIYDDIGIDPGFPVGVVKFRNFIFSTGPRVLPRSRQSESGAPAGVDRAGSIESGEVIPGRLGDDDFDGLLDGTFNAIGRFPYDSVMLPGAPFAQTRVFTTDIPISPVQAAVLTLANGLSHRRLAIDLAASHPDAAGRLQAIYLERLAMAKRHAVDTTVMSSLGTLVTDLTANETPDDAALCAAWKQLNEAVNAADLVARAFDGTAVEICPGIM